MMLRALILTILCLAGLRPAEAQGLWTRFSDAASGMRGAGICPVDGTGPGGAFWCMHLSCTPGTPRRFTIAFTGGGVPAGTLYTSVSVDGRQAGVIEMRQTPVTTHVELEGWWDARTHPEMVQAMSRGLRAEVSTVQGAFRSVMSFSLAGAGAALGAVLAECPDIPPAVADPVAEVMSGLAESCAQIGGGTVSVAPGEAMADSVDIDGDGRLDLVVDHGRAVCSSAVSAWCGSAGCPISVYRATDRGYVAVFDSYARGWDVVQGPSGPLFRIAVHGTACGGIGADACFLTYAFDGSALVRVN